MQNPTAQRSFRSVQILFGFLFFLYCSNGVTLTVFKPAKLTTAAADSETSSEIKPQSEMISNDLSKGRYSASDLPSHLSRSIFNGAHLPDVQALIAKNPQYLKKTVPPVTRETTKERVRSREKVTPTGIFSDSPTIPVSDLQRMVDLEKKNLMTAS
jgi:hypothetical protein